MTVPPYPVPSNERERLAALHSLQMMDTPSEEPFDGIVEVTAALLDVPYAVLTLMDSERQWFKANFGAPFNSSPRHLAFCKHTIMGIETMVVEDFTKDPRFENHPFVVGQPELRFYAGAPLVSQSGHSVGTICVLDVRPRTLDRERTRLLERLASQAMDALEMRKLLRVMADGLRIPQRSAD